MKQNYNYITPFGDDLAIITGKSAARSRDNIRNLRLERRKYADRISALQADIFNLKSANRFMRHHALAEYERLKAQYERLKAENEHLREESTKWRTIAESMVASEKELLDFLEDD